MTGTFDCSMMILQVVRIADAKARADWRGQRHHRGASDFLQPLARDRIIGDVGQHLKPSLTSILAASMVAGTSGNSVF